MAVTPSLSTQFQVADPETSSLFLFTDTTDYGGLGIALADVNGAITVERPDGVIWHVGSHVPGDILPNIDTSNNTITIPTQSGRVIQGQYVITYEIVVTGGVDPGTYSVSYTIDFCLCDDDSVPTPAISWDISCIAAPVITANDATNYGLWSIVSRTIAIYAPPNATPPYNATYSSVGSTVNSGNDAVITGIWTARLEAEIERDFGTHTVTYTLTQNPNNVSVSSASKEVVCQALCSVRCCIDKAYVRWQNALASGQTQLAAQYYTQWNSAVTLLFQAWFEFENCNDGDNTDSYIEKIQQILSCNDDCDDCSGDEEGIITPISGASSSYTFVNGSPTWTIVTVAGNVVTIGLTAAGASILTNVYNFDLALGAALSSAGFTLSAPVITGSNPTLRTRTLNYGGTFPDVVDKYSEVVDVAFTGIGSLVTRTDQKVVGGEFQVPTTMNAVNLAVLSWASQPARFNIAGFWVTPPGSVDYKVISTMQYCDFRGGSATYLTAQSDYIQSTGDKAANSFNLIVIDGATGMPHSWGSLNAKYRSISFQITIQD